MRVFLQQRPDAGEAPRYVQLTLQPDLFGGWELLRETGQIGGRASLKREQYLLQDEANAAFEKARDSHLKRGFQLSEKLDAGMIGLNRGMMSDPAAPFGGVKASGLGREGSHHGLIEFCEAKYVSVIW